MAVKFKKAEKSQAKARILLEGATGSGKTYSALKIAYHLAPNKKIGVIDTEGSPEAGAAALYSNEFPFDEICITGSYDPNFFIEALQEAGKQGYEVVVADSLFHYWKGKDGFLDLVDKEVDKMRARGGKADPMAAWKSVDTLYRRFVDAILTSPCHFIGTLRCKMEYEKVVEGGKTVVKKVGLKPEFREEFPYEMTVEGMLNPEHQLVILKTRCPALDNQIFNMPGEDFANILTEWLNDGAPVRERDWPKAFAETQSKGELDALAAVLVAKLGKETAKGYSEDYRKALERIGK